MAIGDILTGLIAEPPPEFAFEVSAAGIAWAKRQTNANAFQPFESETLRISPVDDNVLRSDNFAGAVRQIVNDGSSQRQRRAAVIVPDFATRMAVLDFDTFPAKAEDRDALLRFRMRKSVLFNTDDAALTFVVQPRPGQDTVDVLAVMMSAEILSKYEVPFRAAGLEPGRVTTSLISALEMAPADGCRVLVKLCGAVLSIAVTLNGNVRLIRCVETAIEQLWEETAGLIHTTIAYIEDELRQRPDSLVLCGFGPEQQKFALELRDSTGIEVEPLVSPLGGAPNANNAGLLGYLASGARS